MKFADCARNAVRRSPTQSCATRRNLPSPGKHSQHIDAAVCLMIGAADVVAHTSVEAQVKFDEYLRSGITGSARIGTLADIADFMQEWCEGLGL
jgi:hypothetical protein